MNKYGNVIIIKGNPDYIFNGINVGKCAKPQTIIDKIKSKIKNIFVYFKSLK